MRFYYLISFSLIYISLLFHIKIFMTFYMTYPLLLCKLQFHMALIFAKIANEFGKQNSIPGEISNLH